jgi:hypothetical protein
MTPEGPPEMEANAEQSTPKRSSRLGCVLAALALAIVLALVWPMLPRPEPSRICLSNVKNISLALQMYLADNDDRLPPAGGWCDRIDEYMWTRDVYRCEQAEELDCAFAYNAALGGVSLASLSNRAETVVIFESDAGWNAVGGRELLPDEPRHLGGDHYGFADGFARWLKRKQLPDGTWAKEPEADVIWEPVVVEREGEPL